MSARGDAEFYADEEIEQNSEEIFVENRAMDEDFTKDFKFCKLTCRKKLKNSQSLATKTTKTGLLSTNNISQKSFRTTSKNSTSMFPTLHDLILLIDITFHVGDVYSHHKFNWGKTR